MKILIEHNKHWGCEYTEAERDKFFELCADEISKAYKVPVFISETDSKSNVILDGVCDNLNEEDILETCQEIWVAGASALRQEILRLEPLLDLQELNND